MIRVGKRLIYLYSDISKVMSLDILGLGSSNISIKSYICKYFASIASTKTSHLKIHCDI